METDDSSQKIENYSRASRDLEYHDVSDPLNIVPEETNENDQINEINADDTGVVIR